MSEASYTAWDDNLYEWPPPDGWYEASDGRWWPEGYGPADEPGAAASAPAAEVEDPEVEVEDPDRRRTAGSNDLETLFTDTPSGRNGSDGPVDLDKTSAFPAGGFAVADPVPNQDPSPAQRRVYDELPPIDDVFGGIDPYSTIETPVDKVRSLAGGDREGDADAGGEQPRSGPGPAGTASDLRDDDRVADAGVNREPAPGSGGNQGGEHRAGAFDLDPVLEDERSFDNAFERVAESLRGERANETPDPTPAPSAFDAEDHGQGPDGVGGRGAGVGAVEFGGPPAEPSRPPVDAASEPADPDATKVTESPYRPGRLGADVDDGATAPLDVDSLRRAQEAIGAGRTVVSSDAPPEVPALEGRFELPESIGGYAAPALDRGSGPRRWWPLVVIGVAVLAAAVSTAAYFVFRGDGVGDGGTDTAANPNGQGAFADPYPVGAGVVVYYNDEATAEQRRWVIQVVAPVVDATETLVAEASADRPADGEVLAMARIRVAYQSGPEPGSVADLQFDAAGSVPSATFEQGAGGCSAVTEPLDRGASLLALESVEGNVCWRIPASELESLKLAVEAGPAAGTVHLSLG